MILPPLQADPNVRDILANGTSQQKQALCKRGTIDAADDLQVNLCAVFNYQRAHADAARDLFAVSGVHLAGGRLVVVDLGCGAATEAIALTEALTSLGAGNDGYDYIGVDHNGCALDLSEQMLAEPGILLDGCGHALVNALPESIDIAIELLTPSSVPMLTTSYLFHQDLDAATVTEFVEQTARLVVAAQDLGIDGVHLFGTDANTDAPYDWLPDYLQGLDAVGLHITFDIDEYVEHASQYCNLYPANYGDRLLIPNPFPPGYNNLHRWKYLVT